MSALPRFLRLGLLAILACAFALAGEAPDPSARIDQLIADLSADSWQARQRAQEALVQMGHSVRQRLERLVVETQDEEVRTRAEAVLRGLEDGRLSGPTLVTLRLKNATPRQVFAELARQGFADIRPDPPELLDDPRFTPADFDIVSEPFWSAMMKVCRHWSLSSVNSAPGQLTLTDFAAAPAGPASRMIGLAPYEVSGAFLVAPVNITRNHSVDLASRDNVRRYCSIQLMVLPEPKMRILQGSTSAGITEAIDENGRSLMPPALQTEHMQVPYSPFWFTHCQLLPPPDAGKRIATLRGSLRFIVQTRVESGRIDNPLAAKNAEAMVAGRRFVLKELVQTGDKYVVSMTAQRSALNANEFTGASPPIQFRLLDAQGVPLDRIGLPQMRGGTPEQAEIELQFQRPGSAAGPSAGAPARLVWDIPIDSREIEVPFVFKDVPLP